MTDLLPFFIVLFAGLFLSGIFSRLHLPWVVALILTGIFIGPSGLDIFTSNVTLDFLAQIGLVFLMFMAGLHANLSGSHRFVKGITELAFLNGLVPLLAGVGIGFLFGYDWIASLLIGIIFMSSSIAVVIPSLEASGLIKSKIGQTIVAATIFEDIGSLIFLSILLQSASPITVLPLPVFYILLFLFLVFFRWLLPKLRWLLSRLSDRPGDIFQHQLRSIFVILIGTVIAFELLGLHPIIAGFFAGLVLSGSVTSSILKDKLQTLSYGFFIPIFFVIIGSKTDIRIFFTLHNAGLLALVIVFGSLISKFTSGWIGGRLAGFNSTESVLIGSSTIPQLSTTLAAVFAGFELGILDQKLVSAMVMLSIITTLIAPILIKLFSSRVLRKLDLSALNGDLSAQAGAEGKVK